MHMSDSKDETLFFDQILLQQLLQCVLASQQFCHREFMISSQGCLQTTGEV